MNQPDGARPLSEHSLRAFRPDPAELSSDTPLSPQMTLSEFYAAWVLDHRHRQDRVRPTTIKRCQSALRLWVELTGDPPLVQIDDTTCSRFEQGLRSRTRPSRSLSVPKDFVGKPLSASTMRTTMIHLEAMLEAAGPKIKKRQRYARLIDEPPAFEMPRASDPKVENALKVDQVSRLIGATGTMTTPLLPAPLGEWLTPALWWQSLLLLGWHMGMRISELILWRTTWINASGDTVRIPGAKIGEEWNPEAFDGTFALKGKKPRFEAIGSEAQRVIARLAGPGHTEKLLPWPHTQHYLIRQFNTLATAAGVQLPCGEKFKLLRKGHGQSLPADALTVQESLGHKHGSTTRDHYAPVSQGQRAAKELMPSPAVDDGRQGLLF